MSRPSCWSSPGCCGQGWRRWVGGLGRDQPGGGRRRCSARTDALAAAGIAVPAKYDPLHRLRGWRELGDSVAALLTAHPGLTLLADDRELLAALIYYVRPHPFGAVEWNPIPGITDHWRLTNNIGRHRGEDFLAVTVHDLVTRLRPRLRRADAARQASTSSRGRAAGGVIRFTSPATIAANRRTGADADHRPAHRDLP